MRALAIVIALLVWSGTADAYPQFQLAFDQTCSGCHISPTGGNLLNENGLASAESISQLGTAPEFMYGALGTPAWLTLGGDLRASTGFIATPEKVLASFPMQIELYGAAVFGSFSVHANFGPRPSQFGNEVATSVWSREHYLMWRQNPDDTSVGGVYARAGRFMPVFGLRFAEHPSYVRRYGGAQLYSETYGINAGYVSPKWEAHVTGFLEDPLTNPVEPRNGVAALGEVRVTEAAALGLEGMYQTTADDSKIRAGVLGKYYLGGAGLLLQAELQYVYTMIDGTDFNVAQVLGYLMGSKMLGDFLMLDIGVGYFDQNLRISEVDREAVDVNLHYFLTSHIELVWNSRFEMLSFGKDGPNSGYSLLQLHYRL